MSPQFYRSEAERARRLAETQTDPMVAAQLQRMASDYDALAEDLESSSGWTRSASDQRA